MTVIKKFFFFARYFQSSMINKRGICSTLAGLYVGGGKKGDLCCWLELKANPGWFTLQNKCKGGWRREGKLPIQFLIVTAHYLIKFLNRFLNRMTNSFWVWECTPFRALEKAFEIFSRVSSPLKLLAKADENVNVSDFFSRRAAAAGDSM